MMNGDRVGWGLLSTARINERLIPAIRESERSSLIAVASRNKESAVKYAREWNIPRAYGTYEELLQDSDVKVVYIPLPNSMHAEWTIKCADAGKHILCEKPMALSLEDVDQMAHAARQNGVVLQEATMYRYHPQTMRVLELVKESKIGEIRVIRGVFTFTLLRDEDIRLDPDLGGGSLWDLGGYPVSFIRTIMQSNPVEVHAWQVSTADGVDLTFAGQMRFASGAFAQFTTSFQALIHWEANILGSNGLIHLDHPWLNNVGDPAHLYVRHARDSESTATFGDSQEHIQEETITFEDVQPYYDEVEAMVAAIVDGADPIISLADSRGAIKTLVALYQSARIRRPVKLSEVRS